MPRTLPSLARPALLALLALASLAAPCVARTLYAVGGNAGPTGGQSALYTVDVATGIMTWVGGLHTAGSTDNSIRNGGLAYDPFTDRMYALGCDSSVTSALFLVNRSDASMTRIGYCNSGNPYAFCSGGLAFDVTTGRLFAVGEAGASSQLYELDTNTGAATHIGANGEAGTHIAGLGADPLTGVLYGNGFLLELNSRLYVIDKTTGLATSVGFHGLTLGRQMNYSGPAIDPATGYMYSFGSFSGSANHIYRVDKSTGLATDVAPESPNGVGVDGALAYAGTDLLDVAAGPLTSVPLRAWPNPAHGKVTFAFALARSEPVSLAITDVAGRRIALREAGPLAGGGHTLAWDGAGFAGEPVAPGIYFATLRAGNAPIARTTVLMLR